MQMLRVKKIPVLLLLLFILFSAATASSDDKGLLKDPRQRVIEGFVMGFVDKAIEPGISSAKRDEFLKEAMGYAGTYCMINGDNTLCKKIQYNIIPLAPTAFSLDEGILEEFQKIMPQSNRFPMNPDLINIKRKIKQRAEGFVEALIEKALEPGIPSIKREELLAAATSFATTYGSKMDDDIFNKWTQNLILNLPPSSISIDEDIIKEFQKALLHDNRL